MQGTTTKNGDDIVSASGNGFIGNLLENIRLAGGSPGRTLGGFLLAWAAFFLILTVLPMPEVTGIDGAASVLKPAGKAVLAPRCVRSESECWPRSRGTCSPTTGTACIPTTISTRSRR